MTNVYIKYYLITSMLDIKSEEKLIKEIYTDLSQLPFHLAILKQKYRLKTCIEEMS